MTLEKLLIFGFGLAVTFALASMATGIAGERPAQANGYKNGVTDIIELAG